MKINPRKRIMLTVVLLIVGLAVTTQIAAYRMDYPPGLSGCFYVGDGWALYAPWSLIVWSLHETSSRPAVEQSLAGFTLYALMVAGIAAMLTRHTTPKIRPFGGEGWGTRRDMKRAGLLNDAGTVVGLCQGNFRGRLLTYDGPEHQLVSGASRSGKGVGHVVPTLLCWPGSALVYDVKNELWDLTSGCRARHQHCLFFNPTSPDSARFNPMLEVRKGPNEIRDAQNLVEILINPDGAKKTLDVWDQNAFQFLTALVLHVLYTEPLEAKHLGRVRELLLDFDATCAAMITTSHRLNPQTDEPEPYPEIARVAKSLLTQAQRFRSSVRGTAEGYLTLWADEIVCQVTSRSDFTLGDLVCLDKPMTLYLQPPPSDADRVRPLIRLILNQVNRALMEHPRQDARGREKRYRLLMLIDEFPTLGRLPFFSESLRQMAGYGIKAHLIVQSFNDIIEAYGPHNTIIDNCHVLCCFASADTVTQRRISEMTGEAVEYRESYSRPRSILLGGSGGSFRGRSISQAEQVRPLLRPGEVRTLGYDEQLIFVTGFKPFRTKKLRYYAFPALQRRVLNPPTGFDLAADGAARSEDATDWHDERAKGDPLPLPEDLDPSSPPPEVPPELPPDVTPSGGQENSAPGTPASPGTPGTRSAYTAITDHEHEQGDFL